MIGNYFQNWTHEMSSKTQIIQLFWCFPFMPCKQIKCLIVIERSLFGPELWLETGLCRDCKNIQNTGNQNKPMNAALKTIRVTKSKNFPDSKIFVAKTFWIKHVNPANFQIHIFEIIQTLFRSYGNFPDHSHSFQIIRTHYLHLPDTFRIIRKLSRLTRHTPRLSRLFSDYPDTFSRLTGHF